MSWLTSTGSLQSLNVSLIFDFSCAMSSNLISSTGGSFRLRIDRPLTPSAVGLKGTGARHSCYARCSMRPPTDVSHDRRSTFEYLLHLPRLLRLYWRLLRDGRVSIWPKAMLLAAAAYVVLPFDFIPDVVPLLGEVD